MTKPENFPIAQRHGDISELFGDVFWVTGTVAMAGPLPMRFSRNMTILRQGNDLTLVNSVRLQEDGLKQLDGLGDVKHVVRLAGFHGMDDPFYKHRYGATVWSVDSPYTSGFDANAKAYFRSDTTLTGESGLPISGARLLSINSATRGEGLLLLEREGGILISGDCLQNWAKADRYFNLPARILMKLMGFLKPHNLGPGWLKAAKPDALEIKSILNCDFNHVLPAHGSPVIGDAKQLFAPRIAAL